MRLAFRIFRTALVCWAAAALSIAYLVKAAPNALSDAEIQGRALAEKILADRPENNYTNSGILEIRDSQGKRVKVPVEFKVSVSSTNWVAIYSTKITNAAPDDSSFGRTYFGQLTVIHSDGQPNVYLVPNVNPPPTDTNAFICLTNDQIMTPFARSDFCFADLGLEFFHWPQQKVLPKTTNLRRGRDYTLLESTNPHPEANGYSRVVCWIDRESDGILEAQAYDASGNKLKDFEPKNFEKVKGQYQVESMIMDNTQTGSQSRLEFDYSRQ